jgi:hypothetical protein
MFSCGHRATSSVGSKSPTDCTCSNNDKECKPLPDGTPNTIPSPDDYNEENPSSTTCPAGYYCQPQIGNTPAVKAQCPVNYYCPAGTPTPLPCTARAISSIGSGKASDCKCETTTLTVIIDSTTTPPIFECHRCVAGQLCDGSTTKRICPSNHYCPAADSNHGGEAHVCPATKPKSPAGSISESQCRASTDCDDGEIMKDGRCAK